MTRLDIWNSDVTPEIVVAATGAGKFASDLSIRLVTYMGSAIWVSVKPELCDFALGRNVDNSRAFARELRAAGLSPGVKPTGITQARFRKPRFRSFLLDPYQQSVYGEQGHDCGYNFLKDLPANDPRIAIPRTEAFCEALIVRKENATSDPIWVNAPRDALFGGIGHVLTRFPPPLQSLATVADFLMGKDPNTGGVSTEQFKKNLAMMMANSAWGGTIAAAASRWSQAGERFFGPLNYEIGLALRWVMAPAMRKHTSVPQNQFSFEDVGDPKFPMSVFVIPGRVAPDASSGYMRTIVAMFTAVMKTKTKRPLIPVVLAMDEARQYVRGTGAAEAALVLRDNRVKQIHYYQNLGSAQFALGETGFTEYTAASTMRFYGIRRIEESEMVSNILGQRTSGEKTFPLADAQTILRELAISSNLQYVLPYAGPPVMRLERRGFKTIRTKDLRLRGLPLDGHYDDGLSRFH